jgi:hypothetical protein
MVSVLSLSFLAGTFSSRYSEGIITATVASQIVGKVNGTNAYNYDLEIEGIANNHSLSNYAFRSSGSRGANATADWIADQFQSFGLDTYKESFQFTNWDVLSKPSLMIDDDGNAGTTEDQSLIESFQCEHYGWPTPPSGEFADLVILPLPSAADHLELGANPINTTEWNAIDTTGRILLVGREVRWASSWESTYVSKLTAQTPAAVVYTWWYDWMSFCPDFFSSIGGRPYTTFGTYYWNLGIPAGFVDYTSGLWIRNREASLNVSTQIKIEAVVGTGPNYNVIGKLAGSKYPDKFVIVSGHYDTVMTNGFCDNGGGTAGVIELARIFSEANTTGLLRPKYTILFILFTGEELDLVGSINYIMKHKSQMGSIVAVINMDCIGNRDLRIAKTNPGPKFDLDELLLRAAQDLGVNATLMDPGGSDQEAFRNPSWANTQYSWCWGLSAGIAYVTPVESSSMLISYPVAYYDQWNMGTPGWIHTPYDNSTSTVTFNWVEVGDLDNHLRVAALSLVRIVSPILCDVNSDGTVNMRDINQMILRFQTTPSSPNWNPDCDVTGPTWLVPDSVINMRDIQIAILNFNGKDL